MIAALCGDNPQAPANSVIMKRRSAAVRWKSLPAVSVSLRASCEQIHSTAVKLHMQLAPGDCWALVLM